MHCFLFDMAIQLSSMVFRDRNVHDMFQCNKTGMYVVSFNVITVTDLVLGSDTENS